jgi:hypothetical protein
MSRTILFYFYETGTILAYKTYLVLKGTGRGGLLRAAVTALRAAAGDLYLSYIRRLRLQKATVQTVTYARIVPKISTRRLI